MVFIKLLIFIVGSIAGIYLIKNHEHMVRLVGKQEWAEKFTSGGSYTMWILIGSIVIILSFLILLGRFDFLFR